MRNATRILAAVVLVACGTAAVPSWGQVAADPKARQEQVEKFIATLRSQADVHEKYAACLGLAQMGGKEAVPALAELLADEKLSNQARGALEAIPDPAAGAALREALGKVKGKRLVGVINSLGVRKEEAAVEGLVKLLSDEDAAVAEAAAAALGKIGGPAAAEALAKALAGAGDARREAFCAGYLACADALVAQGKPEAKGMYERLRADEMPGHIRMAALRGIVLADGAKPEEIAKLLLSQEAGDFLVGLGLMREIKGEELTVKTGAQLMVLPVDKKVPVLEALGARGDLAAVPAVLAAVRAEPVNVRVTAIKVLTQLGSPAAVPALVELALGSQNELAQAAQASLAAFPGEPAEKAILEMVASSEARVRVIGVNLVGQRRITAALPALFKATGDAEEAVQTASLKVIGELGGAMEVAPVVELLVKAGAAGPRGVAEAAVVALCQRTGGDAIDKVLAGLEGARGESRVAVLRVLRAVGGSKALAAVRAAAGESDAAIKEPAVRLLCEWASPEALPDVMKLARSAEDAKVKALAWRGATRMLQLPGVAAEQKFAGLKEMLGLAGDNDEKKLALAALGGVPTAEALGLVRPFLAGELKEEASLAAVAIVERMWQAQPGAAVEAMDEVLKATKNEQTTQRAKSLRDQAKGAVK